MAEVELVEVGTNRYQMQDSNWWTLIASIKEQNLIPVIGPDLIRVSVDGKSLTIDKYIAQTLAANPEYHLTEKDFSQLGVTLEEASLNDVVSLCLKNRHADSWKLHADVWQIVDEAKFPVPSALTQLAEITPLNLFVSASFDRLLWRALEPKGFEELVYRTSDKKAEDLPRRRTGRRFLYYLFGKAERGRGSEAFPICDVELLSFFSKLHHKEFRPTLLFDALRENHLLLLGVNFGDWLARFFLWMAKNRDENPSTHLREYLDDPAIGRDRSLILFLQYFSNSTVVIDVDPCDFVAELYRRWQEDSGTGQGTSRATPAAEMPRGGIFLSYSHTDRTAVESLFTRLSREGLAVWYDAGLHGGDLWEDKLRRYIDNCGVFVPLLSQQALDRSRSEFRAEWLQAVEMDKRRFGTGATSIIPVVVDSSDAILRCPQMFETLPSEFARAQMYHCPGGEPSRELLDSLRNLLKKFGTQRSKP